MTFPEIIRNFMFIHQHNYLIPDYISFLVIRSVIRSFQCFYHLIFICAKIG